MSKLHGSIKFEVPKKWYYQPPLLPGERSRYEGQTPIKTTTAPDIITEEPFVLAKGNSPLQQTVTK